MAHAFCGISEEAHTIIEEEEEDKKHTHFVSSVVYNVLK